MALVDLENPWTFGVAITVTVIVLVSVIEVVLFDGDVLSAVIQGLAMGLMFSVLNYYGQRDGDR